MRPSSAVKGAITMRNRFPNKTIVQRIRLKYPKGSRVELVRRGEPDPYSSLKPGDRGTVSVVDDTGTVFVNWDNGSGLGVVYGVDEIKRLD